MTLSDIIAIIDIFVTIFVGFFLAHRLSVRDTRTRSVKDYYISELSSMRKIIEETFSDLLDEKMSAYELIKWTGDMESVLSEFDEGLRTALPIYARPLQEEIGDVIDELTDLENINDQFDKSKITLSTDSYVKIRDYSHRIHEKIANYLYLINNADSYGWLYELTTKYKNIKSYYKAQQKNFIVLRTICNILYQCVQEYIWVGIFLIVIFVFVSNISLTSNSQEQDATLLKKQDIDTVAQIKHTLPIDSLLIKMFPAQQVHSKEGYSTQYFIKSK